MQDKTTESRVFWSRLARVYAAQRLDQTEKNKVKIVSKQVSLLFQKP